MAALRRRSAEQLGASTDTPPRFAAHAGDSTWCKRPPIGILYSTLVEVTEYLRALTAHPCQAVIAALKASDALTVADLRAQTRMSTAALSRTVGQLRRLGLVEQT